MASEIQAAILCDTPSSLVQNDLFISSAGNKAAEILIDWNIWQ